MSRKKYKKGKNKIDRAGITQYVVVGGLIRSIYNNYGEKAGIRADAKSSPAQ